MGRPWILPLRGIHYHSQGHSRLKEALLAPKLASAWDMQLVSEPHSVS